MTKIPDDKTLTGLGRAELLALVRALEVDRASLVRDLKEVRVRLESASAVLHSIIESSKSK